MTSAQDSLLDSPVSVRVGVDTSLRRRDRFAARSWLWKNSRVARIRRCSSRAISTDGVGVRWSLSDTGPFAGYSDLDRCGSVWSCPVCSAKIAASRAEELTEGYVRWDAKGAGLTFVTLTMRHHKGQRLVDLWDGVASAWAAVTRGAVWTGSPCGGTKKGCSDSCKHQVGDKKRHGIVGTVRATEVTHGDNGWHVHLHLVVFTEAPLTQDAADAMGLSMFTRWKNRLVKDGFDAPTLKNGVDAKVVRGGEAAAQVAEYFAKNTYDGIAWETAGGSLKEGRQKGRSPFQILYAARAGDSKAPALWFEWEEISQGRRQIVWSRGLREKVLGTEKEESDQELADKSFDGETLGRFQHAGWKIVRRRPGALADVLESAETGTNPEEATNHVRTLVNSWGVAFVDKANEVVYEAGLFAVEDGLDVFVSDRSVMKAYMDRVSCSEKVRRQVVDVSTLTLEQQRHLSLMSQCLSNSVEESEPVLPVEDHGLAVD